MLNWKLVIAGFCIPVNIFFIVMGIIISDTFAITLGLTSIALVCIPLLRDYNAASQEKKQENPEDKKPLS